MTFAYLNKFSMPEIIDWFFAEKLKPLRSRKSRSLYENKYQASRRFLYVEVDSLQINMHVPCN